jgi:hypothetical protein
MLATGPEVVADELLAVSTWVSGVNVKLSSMGFDDARLPSVMDCVTDGREATAAAVYHKVEIVREWPCDSAACALPLDRAGHPS